MQSRTWICLVSVLLLAGCGQDKETSKVAANPKPSSAQGQTQQSNAGDNKPILNVDSGQAAAMHVTRAKDIQALKADMTQIAQFYIQYESENGKPPANWQEFKAYMGNDGARYAKEVDSDKVAIVYGVKPTSNSIIAYEKKPDLNGVQVVVFGDKHVASLTPAQLKQGLEFKQ